MSKGKLLAVCCVWLLVLGIGVLVWRAVFVPARQTALKRQQAEEAARQEREREEERQRGGSKSRYVETVDFRLDSFSGYAVLRSETFRQQLSEKQIRLNLHDDGADYLARIKALKSGEADLAAFTVDALIKVCAETGDLPATIVAVIDETTGADAIVAYKETVPNVDALNRPDMRFVLTPNSPSETLARVVMSRFNLDRLAEKPFVEVAGVEEVVRKYTESKPADPAAYVLWEPSVSQVLQNPAMHAVVDSSRFPAAIVDVIVASDDFVTKSPRVLRDFVESYLRAVYAYRERSELIKLVLDDARRAGAPLKEEQASKLVDGIWWKNTQENLAHVGLLPEHGLPHLEDIIADITEVLLSTGGIARDPTDGQPSFLYFSQVLEELRDFHPGAEAESVRQVRLPSLTDAQWEKLTTVGTARVPALVFARGTDQLTELSRAVLDDLAQKLKTTRYYVIIRGNAAKVGDPEQNKLLAQRRAKAAEQYLIGQGVDVNRIRAVGTEPSGETSVSFVLGQLPY